MRIAWFSPLPPDRSGIAAYSAELLPLLTSPSRSIDLYIDVDAHADYLGHPPSLAIDSDASYGGASPAAAIDAVASFGAAGPDPSPALGAARSVSALGHPVFSAQDFVWRHRRAPYDLVVYQLGNARCHDYMWAYLFRYPGLLILHDLQVHQSRALWLLRRLEPRLNDYLAEVRGNHPGASPDLGYLFAAGLGGMLYHHWPLTSLLIRASRLTVVHNARLADRLGAQEPESAIASIEMGVADGGAHGSADVPAALGIPPNAIVIGVFGGVTPEKRVPELLRAVAALPGGSAPVHVLCVGQRAPHYDIDADIRATGLDGRVHVTGYVPDEDLPAHMAATDICSCLRWPSNGETSASWLRTLAAGRATIVTALAHLADVPALTVGTTADELEGDVSSAVTVAVDPLDEPIVLTRVLAVLCRDASMRQALGANARRWWETRHRLSQMAESYERLFADAVTRPIPAVGLPAHLRDDGTQAARAILHEMRIGELPW